METQNHLAIAKQFVIAHAQLSPEQWQHLQADTEEKNIHWFWWNEDIPLADIPLIDTRTKKASGYLLVSANKNLPPVLEYALEGHCLKEQTDNFLAPSLQASEIMGKPVKYHFITSTELLVEIPADGRSPELLISIPGLLVMKDHKESLQRRKDRSFDQAVIAELWNFLSSPPAQNGRRELSPGSGIRYSQNCAIYHKETACTIDTSGNAGPCGPNNSIAGCVPVAWSLLLSAWKQIGFDTSYLIWNNSRCWQVEWPSSYTSNPNQCNDVNTTIWRLHQLLGTDNEGSTYNDKIINGANIFGEFGIRWKFRRADNAGFDFAAKIIEAGQPFIFDGQGYWNRSGTPGPKTAGHAVLVYGYQYADRTLLVNLGWGTSYVNKYISHDQYDSKGFSYITSLSESTTGDDIVQVH